MPISPEIPPVRLAGGAPAATSSVGVSAPARASVLAGGGARSYIFCRRERHRSCVQVARVGGRGARPHSARPHSARSYIYGRGRIPGVPDFSGRLRVGGQVIPRLTGDLGGQFLHGAGRRSRGGQARPRKLEIFKR